jgi:hypothetical protein
MLSADNIVCRTTKLHDSCSARVRFAALLCRRKLFARGGKQALVLIQETLFFLSELQPDDDAEVHAVVAPLLQAMKLDASSGQDFTTLLV